MYVWVGSVRQAHAQLTFQNDAFALCSGTFQETPAFSSFYRSKNLSRNHSSEMRRPDAVQMFEKIEGLIQGMTIVEVLAL